jgi:hypothetical protein
MRFRCFGRIIRRNFCKKGKRQSNPAQLAMLENNRALAPYLNQIVRGVVRGEARASPFSTFASRSYRTQQVCVVGVINQRLTLRLAQQHPRICGTPLN